MLTPLLGCSACGRMHCANSTGNSEAGLNKTFFKQNFAVSRVHLANMINRDFRFTWPKECLSILENYYNANSYPDECKREEIAHACNTIIQSQRPGSVCVL